MAQLSVQLEHGTYPCEIQNSNRARYLRLKLSHSGVLSVVVPRGVTLSTVKSFVTSQANWVESKLKSLDPTSLEHVKPDRLKLIYLDEVWTVEYFPDLALQSVSLSERGPATLQCSGMVDDLALLHKAFGLWLKKKAERVIPERLALLAEEHGFHFNRVTIRGQKTRWGSCSSKKNINLNYKLLFFESAIVDYVLIHELCHTIEMNHSRRFWDLVADCDENYKQHDKSLTRLARSLPF